MDTIFDIPDKFIPKVRNALTAVAAIGPSGLFGSIDTIAVGAVWTTLFIAIKDKSDYKLGTNPFGICMGVTADAASY